jgi:prephenate dehydratase
MKIAFQGARGAFSHRATQLFAQQMGAMDTLEPLSCKSFDEAFAKVVSGEADFAALPLENSSVGTIVANYDLLSSSAVCIVSELYVPVHHNVLGIETANVAELKEIYSHPVALDQCRQFLASLPNARAVAYWDTSGAAFHVKELNSTCVAAIASDYAAEETGLQILQSRVEDHQGNRTRFGIITAEDPGTGSAELKSIAVQLIEGLDKYKLSCTVELEHKPGSLARLLGALARCEANLTKIESRPIPQTPWHYRFFLEIQLDHRLDSAVLESLDRFTIKNKVFGRYPIWEKPD